MSEEKPVEPTKVVIVDFDMPFMSILNFMIKASLAAIPAAIFVGLITFICWALLVRFVR